MQAGNCWPVAANTTHIVDFDTSHLPETNTAAPATLDKYVDGATFNENPTDACDESNTVTCFTVTVINPPRSCAANTDPKAEPL